MMTQDTRRKTQDTRHKTQDTRHRTQDTEHKTQDTNYKKQAIIKNCRLISWGVILYLFCSYTQAQDTLRISKSLSVNRPREAAFRAAVLPGWGQIYNKKYWKLPIVYGGAAAIGYGIYWNNSYYQYFKNVYQEAYLTGNPQQINLTAAEALRNQFRRNKEQLIIAGVIFYGLTIVDAIVDAHFSNFDVSDDLSFRLVPKIDFSPQGQHYIAFSLLVRAKR
ncbi:MAG: DUF5683 domain-containing protein [Raineya sp.]|nr:DUF5683 domain-containing protein [Raineya sp.]